jgi:hypothetical protein
MKTKNKMIQIILIMVGCILIGIGLTWDSLVHAYYRNKIRNMDGIELWYDFTDERSAIKDSVGNIIGWKNLARKHKIKDDENNKTKL